MRIKLEAPETLNEMTGILKGVYAGVFIALVMAGLALAIAAGSRHGN